MTGTDRVHRAKGGDLKCPHCLADIEDGWAVCRSTTPEETTCPECDKRFHYSQHECPACEEENSFNAVSQAALEADATARSCLACGADLQKLDGVTG